MALEFPKEYLAFITMSNAILKTVRRAIKYISKVCKHSKNRNEPQLTQSSNTV